MKLKDKVSIHTGEDITDTGNHFEARAVRVHSYADARHAVRQILQNPKVAMCTHSTVAYRFTDKDKKQHEGGDDDGESSAALEILKQMRDRKVDNVVVESRKFGQKLGPKRFSYIKNAAMSAIDKLIYSS
ncbi:hypothetical protein KUTeg_018047 [Tegillarca granosa]|uniref:Impact N-terminal domain-containing protein n=1 Tax=Tegillarca granosa TaxID=220873 RepID=A0ABQ9EGQ4_TEGGR|nr:hypothetical protein KUTeg_018047 [Tegillarca granosa]